MERLNAISAIERFDTDVLEHVQDYAIGYILKRLANSPRVPNGCTFT